MLPTYFLDFSYDEVIPLGARSDLVTEYEIRLKEFDDGENTIIQKFDTKEDLLDIAVEQAGYARHGGRKFEMVPDEEMYGMIEEV